MDANNLEEDVLRMKEGHRDAVAAAAVLSAGARLVSDQQAALLRLSDSIGLPPALAEDFRLLLAGGPIHAADVPPLPHTSPAVLRLLAGRCLLLAIRLGGTSETVAWALSVRLGISDTRLHRWLAAIRSNAGAHPLAEPSVDQMLAEFAHPPQFLRQLLQPHGPPRKQVGHISPHRYRHTLDLQATQALSRTLAFEDIARKLSEAVPERVWRAMNAAARVRVGPDQFPELYETYQKCCRRLAIHPEPPLYLNHGGFNAMTSGIEQPFVILNDLLVGVLSQKELEFVIGHELGHIKFDHVLYLTIAQLLKIPGAIVRHIPIVGPLLMQGLDMLMFEWLRKAELSCDRAGLLCCQDADAGFRVMMRSAGAPALYASEFNVDAFIRQYDELQEQQKDILTRGFYLLSTLTRSHPWAAVRAKELRDWMDSGDYDEILAECPLENEPFVAAPSPRAAVLAHRCPQCAARVPEGLLHCLSCGASVDSADALTPCAACGADCEPDHRFCEACGAPVAETQPQGHEE